MDELLEIARENFGAPGQRSFSWLDKLFYLNIKKPFWCTQGDDLFAMFREKWQVLNDGIVVWAHIVQANTLLFERGMANCPASVIFTPTPDSVVDPDELGPIARSLFELKNTSPDAPKLAEFADNLTDEMVRTFGLPVPEQISAIPNLFEATTFVTRKHLPNRILSASFFPLVVRSSPPYYNFPLPSRYWPKPLIAFWNDSQYG
ncbi:MAG: hypothetical protein HN350_16655 [Phycisphaerales bacterium]|nr:hypothetical protein [Phycisphaerales bacterium]